MNKIKGGYEPIPLFKNAEPWIKIVWFLTKKRGLRNPIFSKNRISKLKNE
jgi:hypothetical protein